MGRADIHGCDRNPYGLALALYKIQFEEIWYHEIISEIMSTKNIRYFDKALGFSGSEVNIGFKLNV